MKSGDCGWIKIFKKKSRDVESPQEKYQLHFKNAVEYARRMIKSGKSFRDIDRTLAARRKSMKLLLDPDDPAASYFGKSRVDHGISITSVTSSTLKDQRYRGIFARITWLMKENPDYLKIAPYEKKNIEDIQYRMKVENPLNENELLELTGYRMIANPPTYAMIFHTPSEKLRSLMPILDLLFGEARSAVTKKEAIKKIGLFHWWYANLMPYFRGSSAIAKMHVNALIYFHSIDISSNSLHNFKLVHGIDIDEWALTLGDPTAFQDLYETALRADRPLSEDIIMVPRIKNFYAWWFD